MATMSRHRQSQLLLLPTEVRQEIYSNLFYALDRELHFCDTCGQAWFQPSLPIWLIRVCTQIHDEVAPILCNYIAPLTLVLDDGYRHRSHCSGSNTCSSAVVKPSQDSLLSNYGRVVREFQTVDFDDVQLRFDAISAYCPNVEKLVLDCTGTTWNIYISDGDDEEEDPAWWLTSPDVALMLVPYWKDGISERLVDEPSRLDFCRTFDRKKGRSHSVEIIAAFEMTEWENHFVSY